MRNNPPFTLKTLVLLVLSCVASSVLYGQNIAIGDITPTEKLHVDGNLKINGLADIGENAFVMVNSEGVLSAISNPILIRSYPIGNQGYVSTPFKHSEYSAAIVGMRTGGGDINEGGNNGIDIIKVYASKSGDNWRINAGFKTHGAYVQWTVDVMFIRRELTDDNR